MTKKALSMATLGVLMSGFAFADTTDNTIPAMCPVIQTASNVAPIAVKIFGFIVLIIGIGSGLFMIIDRERGQMGKGIVVIALAVLFTTLFFVLADPLQNIMQSLGSVLGCAM